MEHIVRIILFAVDDYLIAPAVWDERHEGRGNGLQVPDDARTGTGPHHSVAVALKVHGPHDPVDEVRPGHVGIGLDVDLAAQLIEDADVPVLPVLHQVDGHGPHQPGDGINTGADLRICRQAHIALAAKAVVCIRGTQPCHAPGLLRALSGRRPRPPSLTHFPSHSFAFWDFSMFSRYRMQANTEASNRSIRCSGRILSYWTMSSVFSTAVTLATQYS